jgi:hypothetical protein
VKAIVLSCDRYSTFRNHMMLRYSRAWPAHPLVFRIPYQSDPDRQPIAAIAHEFVRTPLHIKACVLALLDGIDDDEWVYWCIDDKYPIDFDVQAFDAIHALTQKISDPTISGLLLCRPTSLFRSSSINYEDALRTHNGEVFLGRSQYKQIWLHQFLRAKVIRTLFNTFPDTPFKPKDMDTFHRQVKLPITHRLFVSRNSHATFGESTTRGIVTANCASSIRDLGLAIPASMITSNESKIIGRPRLTPDSIFARLREGWALSKWKPTQI